MLLHPALTDKALDLPNTSIEGSDLDQKKYDFYKALYRATPNTNWTDGPYWQQHPFFTQLLDKLLPELIQLATLYGVNLKGFRLFIRSFKGGRSIYDTDDKNPTPNPYNKPNAFYDMMKAFLENIYFRLTETGNIDPKKIRKILNFLSQQLALCGPGVFETLMTINHDLEQQNGVSFWLENVRDTIVYCVAAELFEKILRRNQRLNPRFNVKWFDDNYRSHAHSTVERLAKDYHFPIFKSNNLKAFDDQFQSGLKVNEEDCRWVESELFKRYTPEFILKSVVTTLHEKLSDFKDKNLYHAEFESRLTDLLSPFLDANIFALEDITLTLDDQLTLNPAVYDNLTTYCQQLLYQKGYFTDLTLDDLKTMLNTLSQQYHHQLTPREIDNPNVKRIQSIEKIQADLSVILFNTILSREDKISAAYGLIQTELELIQSEQNSLRVWLKKPLRFLNVTVLETRLERLLNEYRLKLSPTKPAPQQYYDSLHDFIETQRHIIHQNQLIKQHCIALLNDYEGQSDTRTLHCLVDLLFGNEASENMPFLGKLDTSPIIFSFPSEEKILAALNHHAVYFPAKNAIFLKRDLISQYSERYELLIDPRPIKHSDIDFDLLYQLLKLRRLETMSEADMLCLHPSCQTTEAIESILQLDISLFSNAPIQILNLIQLKDLSVENIDILNEFIKQHNSRDDYVKLAFILQHDIELHCLGRLTLLDSRFFTPKGLPILNALLSTRHSNPTAFIEVLNHCIRDKGEAAVPALSRFLAEPGLNIEKLPVLLDFQSDLYAIPESTAVLRQFQAYLPDKQMQLVELINTLKPPLSIDRHSPQALQKARHVNLTHAIKRLSCLLASTSVVELLEESFIIGLRAQQQRESHQMMHANKEQSSASNPSATSSPPANTSLSKPWLFFSGCVPEGCSEKSGASHAPLNTPL